MSTTAVSASAHKREKSYSWHALSRFIEYLKFYDEATYYMEVEGMIQDLHEIWYDFDIETLTEEDAGVYVDRVIQMAEANGAEIQIW